MIPSAVQLELTWMTENLRHQIQVHKFSSVKEQTCAFVLKLF